MNTIQYIKMSLDIGTVWTTGLLNDMKDAPLTQPTSNGGNHPLWVLGHLVYSESSLVDGFIFGNANRYPELEELFKGGSTPSTDPDKYPTMDELMAKFLEMRAATIAHLESLSEEDLDKPSHAPPDFGPLFGTIGACFAAIPGHMSFHTGQVADARRAIGRKPLMA